MCKLENQILNIRAEKDLTNDGIAQLMGSLLGEHIDQSTVAKYFSAQATGIPIKKIEAFLGAFGLKVVGENDVCLPISQYEAMLTFADQGMQSLKLKAAL